MTGRDHCACSMAARALTGVVGNLDRPTIVDEVHAIAEAIALKEVIAVKISPGATC